jgi:LexA-binding, inner membrane-associated putative hydrolase
MANFPTHLAIGTIVSGAAATFTLAADVVAPENLVAVTLAGVLGSVLPDIDLKDSKPSRAMFTGLAVFFSFAVLFELAAKMSVAEMLIIWLGTLFFVRYIAKAIFHRFSYHRGIWHSLLATVFVSLLTAAVYAHLLGRPPGVAWLAAAFMALGYMTHLVLDEIYSVDVMDTRIKQSFGTAVKPIDFNHPGHTAVMAFAAIAAFMVTPPAKQFTDVARTQSIWTGLQAKLLPNDRSKWFGVDLNQFSQRVGIKPSASVAGAPVAATPDTLQVPAQARELSTPTNPITTGTIPLPQPAKPE